MSRPVTVYAEMTPNPATMKFVADVMLVKDGNSVEFLSKAESLGHSSFAEALFNFPFVSSVFMANNFVTVTKTASVDWNLVMQSLREFIKEWLAENENVIEKIPELRQVEVQGNHGVEIVSVKKGQ